MSIMGSGNSSTDEVVVPSTGTTIGHNPSYVEDSEKETLFELYSDYILGASFLITALIAAKRMNMNRATTASSGGGGGGGSPAAETTVVTAFYSLIFVTAILRCLYFFIPAYLWQPSYTPVAVYAFSKEEDWFGYALAELTVTAGSLTLFSIFILILVYWADILKKYYNPGSRRSLPMATFLMLVLTLVGTEVLNLILFLFRCYTTEGMILFNAVLLAITSMICVAEITIFSRKFQNVLKTLGAINQVSTDSQVRRIVWITVTGNLFFLTRATLETAFAISLIIYWFHNKTVNRAFTHTSWDIYCLIKYISELTILALMLHILQSRFSGTTSSGQQQQSSSSQQQPSQTNKAGYTKVPDTAVQV